MNPFSLRSRSWWATVLALASLASLTGAAPPAWWTDGAAPIINAQPADNHAAANLGQAKYMAKQALAALRAKDAATAAQVESLLVGEGKIIPSWDAPSNQEQKDAMHAPLLIGQLKALSAPFYQRLHSVSPTWLEGELTTNQTKDSADATNFHPWTSSAADDDNKAAATIGQLKAVFSLRFEGFTPPPTIGEVDSDGDGVSDIDENTNGTSLFDADTDNDGIPDSIDAYPTVPDTVPLATAGTLLVWSPRD